MRTHGITGGTNKCSSKIPVLPWRQWSDAHPTLSRLARARARAGMPGVKNTGEAIELWNTLLGDTMKDAWDWSTLKSRAFPVKWDSWQRQLEYIAGNPGGGGGGGGDSREFISIVVPPNQAGGYLYAELKGFTKGFRWWDTSSWGYLLPLSTQYWIAGTSEL